MKISRRRLNQIIKEEGQKLNELFGPSEEELVAASSQDAYDLYDAMKGLFTDDSEVERVIQDRSDDLSTLAQEYDQLIQAAGEEEDLATWLEKDGRDEEAAMVRGGDAASAEAAWAAAGEPSTDTAGDVDAFAESTDLLKKYINEAIRYRRM
jgi:hypothetical protein